MPTSKHDVLAKCPFYQYDEYMPKKNIRRIICEGIADASTLVLNYRRKRDFHMQLETFCCGCFDKCEVCRMLMRKYEDV